VTTPSLLLAHTGLLDPAQVAAARELLDEVFTEEMTEADWEHCLGGLHALLWSGPDLVGHAALVQRRLLHRGRALRTGYVEGVAVRTDARRRGHGAALMAALEQVAACAYDLAALGSTDEALPFYAGRGWQCWQGPTSVLTPSGVARTPDADDCVLVLPFGAELDPTAELTCDWRDGDPW
jgi:aminoglycoside 2'-N-acetyltransferase I